MHIAMRASLGYVCEEHDNPADFFLDTIQNVTVEEEGKEQRGTYFLSQSLSCAGRQRQTID